MPSLSPSLPGCPAVPRCLPTAASRRWHTAFFDIFIIYASPFHKRRQTATAGQACAALRLAGLIPHRREATQRWERAGTGPVGPDTPP